MHTFSSILTCPNYSSVTDVQIFSATIFMRRLDDFGVADGFDFGCGDDWVGVDDGFDFGSFDVKDIQRLDLFRLNGMVTEGWTATEGGGMG
ncbi:hypothetical protein Hdeb2414_s0010g00351431 [Helianthus debilis subsp. tardiflorus]